MVSTQRILFVGLFALSLCSAKAGGKRGDAAQVFPAPKDGDTVVFLGDSITWQDYYPEYVEAYYFRRHPDRKIRFVNLGVRGDTSAGVVQRLERDLYTLDPDLVFVMLGMNDGGYRGYNLLLLRLYLTGMGEIVDLVRQHTDAIPVLVSSTCVDPVNYNRRRYNRMLYKMALGLKELAEERKVPFVALHGVFRKALEASKSRADVNLMQDSIHPGPAGHLIIAGLLLDMLEPVDTRKSLLSSLKASSLSWKNNRACLSYTHPNDNIYLSPRALKALPLVKNSARFSSRKLVIEGLKTKVRLYLDGKLMGAFSPAELLHGLEMDQLEKAPWVSDAKLLARLLREKWQLTYYLWDPLQLGSDAWRQVNPGAAPMTKREAYDRLLKMFVRIESLRLQGPRHYSLCIDRAL